MKRRALFGLVLLTSFVGVRAQSLETAPIPVFVSILPEKYFVERVGGERVDVSVLVAPGQSPHTYEPTPRQMSRLAGARLYFRIGMPFEDAWMERLAEANPRMEIVDLREGIRLRPIDALDGAGKHDHAGLPDPHVWTDPRLVQIMAAHIRDVLSAVDPTHREQYTARYDAFARDLEALDADIRLRLKDLEGQKFMVFHPSWGYFADAYDLQQVPIESEGKEPGPRSLARVIDLGRKQGIHVIFVQKQFSQRYAETVAGAIGARVVKVDPLAEDYLDNMRHVAMAFAEALRGS